MCNHVKASNRYDNTLQIYNHPPITELDQALLTLLILLSLLITPVYAQVSSTISPPSATDLPADVHATPYPITNDSLTITELVLANSVIVSDDIPIKIPQDYRYLRTKLNFGTWYYQLHQGISKVTDTMGQFGTKHEPYINLGLRRCASNHKVGSYCPLSAVKELPLDAARIRQQIITAWKTLDGLLAQFITRWNSYDTTFTSPDPNIPPQILADNSDWPWIHSEKDSTAVKTEENEPNAKKFFPIVLPEIQSDLQFWQYFTETTNAIGDKIFVLPENEEQLKANLTILLDVLETTKQTLLLIHDDTITHLEKGFFPTTLFGTNFLYSWLPKKSSQSELEYAQDISRIIRIITQLPMTTVRRKAECDPGYGYNSITTDWVLETLTLVPVLENMTQLIQQKLTPHPFPINNQEPTGTWKIVSVIHLPNFYKQMITEGGILKEKYYTTNQPLHCFSRPATMRSRYCTSEHALQLLVDQCIVSILAQNITEQSCPVEETKQTDSLQYLTKHDDVIDIDNDSELVQPQNLIVTNNDLVSLMTTCKNNNSETIIPLPLASRIHVPVICSLKLLNAPDVLMIQPDTDVKFVGHESNPNYIKTLHDLIRRGSEIFSNDLQKHFHDHGFIYIIVMSSVLLAIPPSLILICVIKRCKDNHEEREQTPPLTHEIFRRSVSRPPLTVSYRPNISLYPTLPRVTYPGQINIA